MNCGIEVLKRLNEIIEPDLKDVILNCEKLVGEKGLSMYDMKKQLEKNVPVKAVASIKIIKDTPYIVFIGNQLLGHYMLVEKIDRHVHVFDPSHQYQVLSKFHFYMLWSKKALIICYNDIEVDI